MSEPKLTPDIPDAVEFFQKQGWTKEQAVGIVANIKRESNFDHTAVGDGGKAFGLAQWHPDRQAEFGKLYGKSIKDSSFEEQLAFIHFELTQGKEQRAGNLLRNAQNGYDAAAIVSKHYERPAKRDFEANARGQIADFILGSSGGNTNVDTHNQNANNNR